MKKKPETQSNGDILTTKQLAIRWNMHPFTLANWRCDGKGPPFILMGKSGAKRKPRVRYRLTDIEAWERQHRETA